MKLYERLPDSVMVRGHRVRLDLDFRNVFRLMDILRDKYLTEDARAILAVRCVTKYKRHPQETLSAIRDLLFPAAPDQPEAQPKLTDFEQDAPMIRAAFLQVYQIDLFRDRLHWLQFAELLHQLPEGNRYTDVLGIRARPIPAPTKYNAKEREWLIKAKAACALHMTDEEQEAFYHKAVGDLFHSLIKLSEGGEK